MSATRADRVLAELAGREVDALLVTNLVNLRWLTGFTGSNGLALAGPDVRRFVTDFRYLSQADTEVAEEWTHEIATDLFEQVVKELPARVGFDDADLTVKQFARLEKLVPEGVELVACGGLIEELRIVKDAEEVEKIRAAARLADEALLEVLASGIVGKTERDVAIELEFAMRRRGASEPSFPSIVASGPHGALPHAQPRDVVIAAGTLVTIDWGAVLDGYASDCTRTFATGEIDPRDREIYDLVKLAQEEALDAVRPGPLGKEVDGIARSIIDSAGHAEHFGHGLGHGVGLEVHEGPRLSKQGDTALAAGHIVTVEPGVYVPGHIGVRIEDLVAVTEDGHDVLSSLPKDLQVVK
jgi:Xaa-Pro aminopeptidase